MILVTGFSLIAAGLLTLGTYFIDKITGGYFILSVIYVYWLIDTIPRIAKDMEDIFF